MICDISTDMHLDHSPQNSSQTSDALPGLVVSKSQFRVQLLGFFGTLHLKQYCLSGVCLGDTVTNSTRGPHRVRAIDNLTAMTELLLFPPGVFSN